MTFSSLGVRVARHGNDFPSPRDVGLSREGLYKALKPGGNPSFVTVVKVARALGLDLTLAGAQKPTKRQAVAASRG